MATAPHEHPEGECNHLACFWVTCCNIFV